MIKNHMERIYREIDPDRIPWNLEAPPEPLSALVRSIAIGPCRLIDLGCGTGNYVIHFSKLGYDATGVDLSEHAIDIAGRSAEKAGASCPFIVADLLGDLAEIPGTYDVAYDWELLHHIYPEDRERYASNVHRILRPGGRYLSVCFSEESPQFGGTGKYRKTPLDTVLYFSSEEEIGSMFSRHFVIEELKSMEIQGKHAPHKVIWAFMRKAGRPSPEARDDRP